MKSPFWIEVTTKGPNLVMHEFKTFQGISVVLTELRVVYSHTHETLEISLLAELFDL